MGSSKFIIKNTAEKLMAKYGFERRFHDLKYFAVGYHFGQIINKYMLNITTFTLLAPSSYRFFLKTIINITCIRRKK
jgi:hypothetical protein